MRRRGDERPTSGEDPADEPSKQLRTWPSFTPLTTSSSYNFAVSLASVLVLVCAIAENVSSTAYGRFGDGAKFAVDPRLGWWLMEIPCTVTFVYFFFVRGGSQSREFVPRLCAFVFCGHYFYRGWIFPYNIRVHGNSKNFSLAPALGGWVVTVLHGYLNALWFAEHGKHLSRSWLRTWRFRLGALLYYSGLAMLIWHDKLLRDLRATPGPRYRIPVGGLFDYATCAQYFVELWTWAGFAILSWGPNGLFIFAVSLVNLVPRAATTHAWYLEKFSEAGYPADRKYLVPFIW